MGVFRSLCAVFTAHVLVVIGILGFDFFVMASQQLRYAVAAEDTSQTMRAAQFREFGDASVIKLETIPRPKCCDETQLLVKVVAGGLNPVDFKQRRIPQPMKPMPSVSGFDFAGHVQSVGSEVRDYTVGDAVFGMLPLLGSRWGSFQEYVVVDMAFIAKAPSSIPLEESAGLPLVGLTVIQALAPALENIRSQGEKIEGKQILVQAGAGGVGSFAIQYCSRVLGMKVATTASAKKAELVKSLGAEVVVDYRTERFEDRIRDYDIALDTVTQNYEERTLSSATVLKKGGSGHYINVLSTDWEPNEGESSPVGLVRSLLRRWLHSSLARFGLQRYYYCNPVHPDGPGLASIAQWVDEGKIRPVIDSTYSLAEVSKAHAYLETGRASGKVLIRVLDSTQ